MPSSNPQHRSLIARIAAGSRWAHERDREAATRPARAGLRRKFADQISAEFPDLASDELERRVDHLMHAHMCRMSLKAAQTRPSRAQPDGDSDGERDAS